MPLGFFRREGSRSRRLRNVVPSRSDARERSRRSKQSEQAKGDVMSPKILYIFTRTPLHVGAGSSVGAIDQPIIRERHTGFPVIPATTLKGVFADGWTNELKRDKDGNLVRVIAEKQGDTWVVKELAENAAWLFGSD